MSKNKLTQFDAYKKVVLPDLIVANILEMIKEGKLQPGEKLPSERNLATQMKIGRPTIRSALRALASMNVIEIRPGSGAYVSSLSAESLMEHLEFVYFLDPKSIAQLYEARRVVELSTVAMAAENITGEELVKLQEVITEMRSADVAGDTDKAGELDRSFHHLIATASHNPLLAQFIEVIQELLHTGYRKEIMQTRDFISTPANDHQLVLDALKNGDQEAARIAMSVHMRHAEDGYKYLLASRTIDT